MRLRWKNASTPVAFITREDSTYVTIWTRNGFNREGSFAEMDLPIQPMNSAVHNPMSYEKVEKNEDNENKSCQLPELSLRTG